MKWKDLFTSSVGKKFVMGITGLFLVSFLLVHAGLNACIFADLSLFNPADDGDMFNKAAHFMGSTVVIRIMEVGLFLGFFVHIIQGLILEFENRRKRAVGYKVAMGNRDSKWYSRSMGLLGTILLLFLLLHWWHFWIPSRFTGGMEEVILSNGVVTHNLFGLMKITFSHLWVVIVYVIGCVSLCWHLIHGFQSAFRTMGVHNNRYLAILTGFGTWYSVIISVVFALMPISMYLGWVG